jgi:hypothetical protein
MAMARMLLLMIYIDKGSAVMLTLPRTAWYRGRRDMAVPTSGVPNPWALSGNVLKCCIDWVHTPEISKPICALEHIGTEPHAAVS